MNHLRMHNMVGTFEFMYQGDCESCLKDYTHSHVIEKRVYALRDDGEVFEIEMDIKNNSFKYNPVKMIGCNAVGILK